MVSGPLSFALAAILLGALAYAAWEDWRRREVADRVWQVAAVVGTFLGAAAWGSGSGIGWALWLLASAFVLEHLLPWDLLAERIHPLLPASLEVGAYVVVVGIVAACAWRFGIGATSVPPEVLAVVATVLIARALFEVGVLYGGADAKALMVAGLLVPLFANPLVPLPGSATAILGFYPYSLNLLMDAAILSAAIPVALAVRNARAGTFEFPRAFTSYRLPVSRLSEEFVWIKDPLFHPEADEAETSEEDRAQRIGQQAELTARGITEVWVTPQLPFVILLLAGAVAALALGNIVFDVVAAL